MIYVGMRKKRDHSLELLLDLDGLHFAQEGGIWIKYEVSTVKTTVERPHGIKYSLTLHDPQGQRIFGIDNAHRPKNLLADFDKGVNAALKRQGARK